MPETMQVLELDKKAHNVEDFTFRAVGVNQIFMYLVEVE
jgi:hypothetical protein